jgi:hypothetical protein
LPQTAPGKEITTHRRLDHLKAIGLPGQQLHGQYPCPSAARAASGKRNAPSRILVALWPHTDHNAPIDERSCVYESAASLASQTRTVERNHDSFTRAPA